MKKRSLSYEQLMKGGLAKVKRLLADADMLDDKLDDTTLARIAHIGRFMARLGNAMPNPKLKVGDVFSEHDLQRFWQETADPDADIGPCPLLH